MAHDLTCPSCGESDALHGEPFEGDIRVTCRACGAVWLRGGARCASCGGTDIVARPQAMTRHSRGTQLSIIGWRQLPLCRFCDSEALERSIAENVPVPDTYVSAALHAPGDAKAPVRPVRSVRPALARVAAPEPDAQPRAAKPATEPAAKPASRPAPQRPKAKPANTQVPTVRQAIQAFLTEASGEVDNTAMLLLGTHLGSYNRLSTLDEPGAAHALAEWFDGRWEDRNSPAGQRALSTVCRAIDFWGARGWLASDPAAELR
ncbi:hypothetical protein [Streptomyces gobiensis]|uniref:hypothetical protein n=1 Tax=Streptomyces gobiensis TaxID=2875706 RepID=UPI001E2AA358|nr:hypothetical protein [Streptomyces gobiensis]UGY94368.1 hypothetical protein test1122_23290 [Streptomyces gobiensis]